VLTDTISTQTHNASGPVPIHATQAQKYTDTPLPEHYCYCCYNYVCIYNMIVNSNSSKHNYRKLSTPIFWNKQLWHSNLHLANSSPKVVSRQCYVLWQVQILVHFHRQLRFVWLAFGEWLECFRVKFITALWGRGGGKSARRLRWRLQYRRRCRRRVMLPYLWWWWTWKRRRRDWTWRIRWRRLWRWRKGCVDGR